MKLNRFLLFFIFIIISSLKSVAKSYDYQTIDGIEYHIEEKGIGSSHHYIATVVDTRVSSEATKISVPSKVKVNWYYMVGYQAHETTIEVEVVSISENETYNHLKGFGNNTNIKVVELPSTIKTIEGNVFKGLPSLRGIYVDKDNPNFTSKEGVLYTKNKTSLIKVPNAWQKLVIDDSADAIGPYAFYGTQIKEIQLSKNIKSIGYWAFTATPNLKSFEIDSENPNFQTDGTAILTKDNKVLVAVNSSRNFYNIPQTVTYCYKGAICNNQALDILVIPAELEEIPDLTNCSNLKKLFSFKKVDYAKLPKGTTLFMPSNYIGETESKNYNIIPFVNVKNTQSRITLSSDDISTVRLTQAKIEDNTIMPEHGKELVSFTNLSPNKTYHAEINAVYKPFTMGGEYNISGAFPITTLKPELDIKLQKATNTTLAVKGICEGDMKVIKHEIDDEEGQNKTIRGLAPGRNITVTYSITTDDGSIFSTSKEFQTKEIELMATTITTTSTSCLLKCSYKNSDATITRSGFYESNSNILKENGLDPNTQYTRTYYVTTKEGGTISLPIKFRTKNIELMTLQPKVVNITSSIVSAKTNIDEDEKNVGFQWRKYDSPSSLKSNESYAPIYNGVLEGFIKNLQATSYYNVRAFYKAKSSKYYYGDWVTFDPGDFSYFEPTVHTYANINVDKNVAQIKGIVIQGSDDIVEQGFEYWIESSREKRSIANINKVLSTGQLMVAEITNLDYNTKYNMRAFATTNKTTIYGEIQQFTTLSSDVSGIKNAISENNKEPLFNIKQEEGLEIAIYGEKEDYTYSIKNISGMSIKQGKVCANKDWQKITEKRLPKGIYIIIVSNNKKTKSMKIALK